MSAVVPQQTVPPPVNPGALRVLVVDDSRMQRHILATSLKRWGYHVTEAENALIGLEKCRADPPDIVLSDWVMPGMDGLEFCQKFRAMTRESYGYFILLTSKTDKDAVAQGLDCGADDFLTKPVNPAELRARITAGERVLRMEQELKANADVLSKALDELQGLYSAIDRDLRQARKIQESLVPDRLYQVGGTRVSMLLKPSGHVGGDLVGVFHPGKNRIGFYSIDVSGHGITSALMTARLASYLTGRFLGQNIALELRLERFFAMRPPDEVARILNDRLLADTGVEEYFTMAYGVFDMKNGLLRLVQAGHPPPLVLRADGRTEFVGDGGLPIGLLPGADFDCVDVCLSVGDRVIFYSDGFTEAEDTKGDMLEEHGLARFVQDLQGRSGPELLEDLFWLLARRQDNDQMADDVSAIMLEYGGPE